MKVHYYHAGYNFFTFEMASVFDSLKKAGVEVIYYRDMDDVIALHNQVIFSNVPTNKYWDRVKDNGNILIHIDRSKDTTYAPHWVNQSADIFCVSNTITEEALIKLLGRKKVKATGMPYLDKYFQITPEQKEEVKKVTENGPYVLGLQVSFHAHSIGFEHSSSFITDYYRARYINKTKFKVFFKKHINHDWKDVNIVNPINLPVEYSPALVDCSDGVYASHFSFMLMEAAFRDKPIYIYPDNPEWEKTKSYNVLPGWWATYDWKKLNTDSKRKELGDAYRAYNDGRAGEKVAQIILNYLN